MWADRSCARRSRRSASSPSTLSIRPSKRRSRSTSPSRQGMPAEPPTDDARIRAAGRDRQRPDRSRRPDGRVPGARPRPLSAQAGADFEFEDGGDRADRPSRPWQAKREEARPGRRPARARRRSWPGEKSGCAAPPNRYFPPPVHASDGRTATPCPSQCEFRSTRWAAIMGRPSSFPAPHWRWSGTPTSRFLMFGDEAIRSTRCSTRTPKLKAVTEIRHTDVAVAHGREAEPGASGSGRGKSSMWRAVQAVRDGEADAAVSAGNTGALMAMAKVCLKTMAQIERPGDRRHVADPARREHRARCRRDHRRRRAASRRHGDHGRGHGAHRLRPRAPDRRPPQRRHRGDQGHRGRQGGERGSCARSNFAAPRLSRLRRGGRSRQGHRRRRRDRGLHRQHRAEDRGGHRQADRRVSAFRHEPHADGEDRLPVRAAGLRRAARTRWIRARSTAAFFSGSRASWSRATAAPMRSASPAPSTSPTTWRISS